MTEDLEAPRTVTQRIYRIGPHYLLIIHIHEATPGIPRYIDAELHNSSEGVQINFTHGSINQIVKAFTTELGNFETTQ